MEPPVSSATLIAPVDTDHGMKAYGAVSLSREVVVTFVSRPTTTAWLTGFVRHRVAPLHVSDLVQDVLLEALHTTSVPSSESALPAWLKTIAVRMIADHHEKRARRAKYGRAMPEPRTERTDSYETIDPVKAQVQDGYEPDEPCRQPFVEEDARVTQTYIPRWKRQRDRMVLSVVLLGAALVTLVLAWLLRRAPPLRTPLPHHDASSSALPAP